MTTIATNGRQTASTAAPQGPNVTMARLPRRRRWGMVGAGAALVVVCALAAYLLAVTSAVTHPYLAVARPVSFGQVIGSDDLTVVNINRAPGLQPIAATDKEQIVGQHAAVNLVPGTLLTRAALTHESLPGAGFQLIGIQLKPAQMPGTALKTQAKVKLVVVPASTLSVETGQPAPLNSPPTIDATIAAIGAPDTNNNVRIDAIVARTDGPTVATMAAAGRIVVVLTAGT